MIAGLMFVVSFVAIGMYGLTLVTAGLMVMAVLMAVARMLRRGMAVVEIGTTRARNGAANAAQHGADYDPRANRF